MKEDTKRVDVRMPESLYQEISASATSDTRSLNAQILTLLREALKRRKGRNHERPSE